MLSAHLRRRDAEPADARAVPDDLAAAARRYVERHRPGVAATPGWLTRLADGTVRIDEAFCREVADHFARQPPYTWNADLDRRYALLRSETRRQFAAIEEAGIRVEPWLGHGQPYHGSADLSARVCATGTLSVFLSRAGHGPAGTGAGPAHPLRIPSGVVRDGVEFECNDLLRAVHDLFGHVLLGGGMGPIGEFRAMHCHLAMYSEDVHPVLFSEHVSQICWFFFGPHLRTWSGQLPPRDAPGWVPPARRPYAEQKVFPCPPGFLARFRAGFSEGTG
jgi:hypothetical protein